MKTLWILFIVFNWQNPEGLGTPTTVWSSNFKCNIAGQSAKTADIAGTINHYYCKKYNQGWKGKYQ